MADYASLEIAIHRDLAQPSVGTGPREIVDTRVELRFTRPDDNADPAPEEGTARFDLTELNRLKENPVAYGRALSRDLFADASIRGAFQQACGAALDRTLRLRLFIGRSAPELNQLRWETLLDPRDDSWLLSKDRLLFSRYLRSLDWRPVKPRRKGELRALVVIASPANIPPIAVDAELELARQSLGSLFAGELVSDAAQPGLVTIDRVFDRLREGYDLLYLVCHGALRRSEPPESVAPVLLFEDVQGKATAESGSRFAERMDNLGAARPTVVVLASCQSAGADTNAQRGEGGLLAALGPRLAAAGVPAVVAMQGNVLMEMVSRFMPVFFEGLRTHGEIDRAMASARFSVHDQQDAWAPALFSRFRDGSIWYEPGFKGEQPGFEHWPRLLSAIRAGKCTPILGPGLFESLVGPRCDIARHWAESCDFPLDQHESGRLPQVAQFLATYQDRGHVWDKLKTDLRSQLLRRHGRRLNEEAQVSSIDHLLEAVGADRRKENDAEPYRVLVDLKSPIYVTANPDDLLSDALRSEGREPQIEVFPWNEELESARQDGRLPSVYLASPNYQPTWKRPLVYHLFGRMKYSETLVLTEDDFFDYLMWVNRSEVVIPKVVECAWSENALLFLGFQPDDWNFKVLFRSILNADRRDRHRAYKSVAVQVSPDENTLQPHRARHYFEHQFREARIGVFWGAAEEFLTDLSRRLPREETGRA